MKLVLSPEALANARQYDLEQKTAGSSYAEAVYGQYNGNIPFVDWGHAQDADGNRLYDAVNPVDPDWKVPKPEQWAKDGLNFAIISQAIEDNKLGSQAAYDNLVERVRFDRNQKEVLEASNGLLNFVTAIPAFLTNPVNAPEIAYGVLSGGTTLAARLAIGAGMSSITGYVDENMRQVRTGYRDEELLANITAISGVFGGLANGVFGRRVGESVGTGLPLPDKDTIIPPGHVLNKTDDYKIFDGQGNLVDFTGDITQIPRGSRMGVSVIGSMYASVSNAARQIASRLDVSGVSAAKIGQTYMGDTVQQQKRMLQSRINNEQRTIKGIYKQNFRKDKSMTEQAFNEKVYDTAAAIVRGESVAAGPLKDAADAYIRALREIGVGRKNAGLPSLENYLTREWNGATFMKLGRKEVQKMVADALEKKQLSKAAARQTEFDSALKKLMDKRNALPKRTKAGTPERKAREELNKEIAKLKKEFKSGEYTREAMEADAGRLYDNVVDGRMDDFSLSDAMKTRKLDLDEADVLQLLNRNASDVLSRLAYRQTGRIATKKVLGFHSEAELKKASDSLFDRIREEGHSVKEAKKQVKNFETNVRHFWGTQMKVDMDSAAQLFKKGVLDLNYATMGGGFAVTAFMGEVAVPIAMAGFRAGANAIRLTAKDLKRLYKGEVPAQEFTAQMQMMVHAFDNINHSMVYRMANDLDDGYNKSTWLNDKLAGAGEFVSNKLGLSTVTENARISLGMAMLHDIFHNKALLKSLEKFEKTGIQDRNLTKLTRLQFDVTKLREIRAMKDKVFKYNKDGTLKSYDLAALGEENVAMLQRGLSNASDLNVLMGDKRHLPIWWSNPDNWALHIMTQFMSYPLHAYESLLVRGMKEGDAAMVTGILTAAFISGILTKAKEEGEIAMGIKDEKDARYDLTTTEGMKHLAVRMLNTSSFLAPLSLGLNTMSAVMTGEALGSEYRANHWMQFFGGPTVSRIQDIVKSLQSVNLDPFDPEGNAWKTVYGRTILMNSGLPLYSAPIVGDGLRYLNKELAE